MTQSHVQRNVLRFAGLTAGPVAWACSTQLAQILPYLDCGRRLPLLAIATFVLCGVTFGAAFLSWRHRSAPAGLGRTGTETRLFSQQLSALAGLLFGFALLLQGAATLVLSACER